MAWRTIVTDLAHVPIGELLNASDRRILKPLSRLDTASVTIRTDNPLADTLLSTECYLKIIRDGVTEFHGPVVQADETVDKSDGKATISAIGGGWELTKRLAGKSTTGTVFSSATDRAQIMKALIDTTNTESETGVDTGFYVLTSGSAISYVAGPYRKIMDILTELGQSTDGYDWRIVPIDNFSGGAVTSQKIGRLMIAPVIGTQKPEAIFEHGIGRNNVASYRSSTTRETQATKVFHTIADGTGISGVADAPTLAKWGLLEDLAQIDITDTPQRQNFLNEVVGVRKDPRRIVEFTPHISNGPMTVPTYGRDFDIGDQVVARSVRSGRVRFNAWFRVWAVELTMSENDEERQGLTLVEE